MPKRKQSHFQRAVHATCLRPFSLVLCCCSTVSLDVLSSLGFCVPWKAISKCAGLQPTWGTVWAVLKHTALTGLQQFPGATSNSSAALRPISSMVENSAITVLPFLVKCGYTYPFHSCILTLPSESYCCSILSSHT